MAYDKKQILAQAIAAIKKHELTTIAEVVNRIPAGMSCIYEPDWQSEVLEPIKKELEAMKTGLKEKLKKKWRNSRAPILQIAAFKLMANEEEKEALNPPRPQVAAKGDGNFDVTLNL